MSKMRKEKDSLGTIEIPAQALYGAQTERARRNYPISGRTAHPELIQAYLRLKSAAARANAICKTLTPQQARQIQKSTQILLKMPVADWIHIFVVDPYLAGAGTSQNMNVNEVLANLTNRLAGKPLGANQPIHPNDHVNRSQSTNDTYPTAMRLAILQAAAALKHELQALSRTFGTKSAAWMNLPKSARTHLQDAVPMSLGQEFGAYAGTLEKCAHWIESGCAELRILGLGGSAAGTGLTVPKGFAKAVIKELSKMTGEPLRQAENLFEAMQSQAPISHYSSMLRLMALELTRICNDLRLLASGPQTGLAEILLPSVQPGSSIMPGKVNPSMLEMANQTWFSVLGYDQTVSHCVQAGQLELNVMMPMMAYSMLEATRVATRALEALRTRCIEGLEPNRPRLRKYFESTPQIATALSPTLGYEVTAALVKEALATETSVVELVRKRKLIAEKKLQSLLAPERVIFGKN